MATQITEDRFEEMLRRHLKYLDDDKPLDSETELKTLGLDSMAALDLLFDIEDTFEVTLPDEYMNEQTFATAKSLRNAVETVASSA
jgi:acyl carrier protein